MYKTNNFLTELAGLPELSPGYAWAIALDTGKYVVHDRLGLVTISKRGRVKKLLGSWRLKRTDSTGINYNSEDMRFAANLLLTYTRFSDKHPQILKPEPEPEEDFDADQ